jgi:hypothetical protein
MHMVTQANTMYVMQRAVYHEAACHQCVELSCSQWRTKYRVQMNKADSEGGSRVIDSLLNYETVKYFDNQAHEQRRYDSCLHSEHPLSPLSVGHEPENALFMLPVCSMAAACVVRSMTAATTMCPSACCGLGTCPTCCATDSPAPPSCRV